MRRSARRSRTLTPKIDHLEERFVLSTLVAGVAVPSPTAHGGWVGYGRNSASTAMPVRIQGLVNGDGASLAHRGFGNSVVVA
ncbi:hypothetical protein BSF38_01546 [Paludisphaera borealis]|uniref:Uncharacterized protein n=1 Tax=Paludisphaera borealis TaxID=1387353 RepID=A0A1U7CMH7_9BACT|nr:hypothetical protein BSF38_01546 [Paludisphaera borealis]